MKKFLLTVLLTTSMQQCQAQVLVAILNRRALPDVPQQEKPFNLQTWALLIKAQKYDEALSRLAENSSLVRSGIFLELTLMQDPALEFLSELANTYSFWWSTGQIQRGLTTAAKKGNILAFNLLYNLAPLTDKEFLDALFACRIVAAGGSFEFLNHLISCAEKRKAYRKKQIEDPEPFDDLNIPSKTEYFLFNATEQTMITQRAHTLPLHAAVAANRVENVRLLLDKKASPCAKDHKNDTALDIAQRNENHQLKELLEKYIE